MSEFTARWETGSGHLTVSCPHGRQWRYDVIPLGDRPLPHFLWELPWVLVPGSEWVPDDADGVWSAVVAPESCEMAGKLFVSSEPALPPSG